MDTSYHFPPDLLALLTDSIPKLCKSKRDVLTFFRSCGVPRALLSDLEAELEADRDSVRKVDQARTVLVRINEGGEQYLRARREVIKRVTEIEDFSICWPADQLAAEGLVAKIRSRVGKHDAFVRMQHAQEQAVAKARAQQEETLTAQQRRATEIGKIRAELGALFAVQDPQRRGRALEGILNRYFAVEGIGIREAFAFREAGEVTTLEQIDGVIEFDAHLYLVEVKWWKEPLGIGEVAHHMVRVAHRGEVRGLVISASGYTEPALTMCRDELQNRIFVLCELHELVMWLERSDRLADNLRDKVRHAQMHKEPLHRIL